MGYRQAAVSTVLLGLAIIAAVPASAQFVDSNDAASATAHANGGGCYPVSISPNLLDMLVLINPEWAPVDVGTFLPPLSDPVTIRGTIDLAKINEGGDFPASHNTDDQNTFVTVDPSDMGLVATGNVGPEGVEAGQIELEWEISSYPLFAWGGTGDHYTGLGRWIFDCGHPNPNPTGTCSTTTSQACVIDGDCGPPLCLVCTTGETCAGVNFNYHSEVHPLQATAVTRTHGYRRTKKSHGGKPGTRTDIWINPDGGGAGDVCTLTHLPNPFTQLATDCFPFSQPIADVNVSDFAFNIPLPPRPPGNTSPPRVRVVEQTPKGLPRARVTSTFVDGPNPYVVAVVHMTTPVHGQLPSKVGKTIFARWKDDPTPVTRVRIDITGVEIVNPLKPVTPASPLKKRCSVTTAQDCSVTACPSGETCLTLGGPTPGWQMFFEANGDWHELTGLGSVSTPVTIPEDLKLDAGLIPGDMLQLHITGKSLGCLESQLYGTSLPRALALYGLTDGASCLADGSHDIGTFDISYTGPDFGSGGSATSYVTQSIGGAGGNCSVTTSQLCLGTPDCPSGETCIPTGGAFKLHYTIKKIH